MKVLVFPTDNPAAARLEEITDSDGMTAAQAMDKWIADEEIEIDLNLEEFEGGISGEIEGEFYIVLDQQ